MVRVDQAKGLDAVYGVLFAVIAVTVNNRFEMFNPGR
jgi:hypothetical protein